MRALRWPLILVLLSLAVIALLLGRQPAPTAVESAVTPAPASGGVYREALIGAPMRFNPLLSWENPVDRDVNRLIYSSLIRFDDHGLPQPELVESWGISRDQKVYNLSLRADARWHDGEPVTSEDVIFTIHAMRNGDLPIPSDLRDFWKQVNVKAFDERTVQFRLPEPFAPFLDYLAFPVLPAHIWEGMKAQEIVDTPRNLQPVGSGPYRFDRLIVEDGEIRGVVLQANADYYLHTPYIETVELYFYPDAQSALNAYREGKVMGLGHIPEEILSEALTEPNLNLYTSRLPRLSLILFNLENPQVPFLQDAAVRRALLMGLNRRGMIDRLMAGQGLIADGPIFPNTWAYYEGVEHIAYDPEGAVKLLRDAGYTLPAEGGEVREKDGTAMDFTLLYPADDLHQRLAEAIQRDWARLGVRVTLVPVTYDQLLSDYLEPRTYQAALIDLDLSRSPDPDPYPFWHQTQATGGQNYARWDNRQASEYLEQARLTVDYAERALLYRNFQVLFMRELPALPLFYPVYTYGVDAQVRGVRVGPMFDPSDRFATIADWYLVSQPTAPTR